MAATAARRQARADSNPFRWRDDMSLFRRKPNIDDAARCPSCGERLPDDATECAMCGGDLTKVGDARGPDRRVVERRA
jgi:zinc-ribbon domain